MVNTKNKWTLSPLGFYPACPDVSGIYRGRSVSIPIYRGRCGFQPHRICSTPVGAVRNRTGFECLINSKIHHKLKGWIADILPGLINCNKNGVEDSPFTLSGGMIDNLSINYKGA